MNEHPRQSVIILGGSGGIGACLARRLATRNVDLCLVARDPERLAEVAESCGARSATADATDFEAVKERVTAFVGETGRLDGMVNCVGSIVLKPAHLTSQQDFNDVVARNLGSAFAAVRAAAPAMRATGGSIVLVSSAAAGIGLANHEAIAAAKAGVEGLTRAAAATYAAAGIRINAVAPGLVDTPLAARLTSSDAARRASEGLHPLGRIGCPEDIAEAISWLLGESGTWVTGQVIGVDGGLATLKTRPRS